jgi:Domain of unknown function (DUF397)
MAEWTRAKDCSANSCIEVLLDYGTILIRGVDASIVVEAMPDEWAAFVAGVKAGDFDHITEEATG